MDISPQTSMLQDLRRFVLRREADGRTDGELLECFISRRDEPAFEVLVRRHGPMVLGVCRRVLGSWHDAEDAFQATFLVLARKASRVAPRELVGHWLYGVAWRTAAKARVIALRRRAHEAKAGLRQREDTPGEAVEADVRPLLDQELSRLPERYRLPIVLCDLQGRARAEAARQLGVPEGTVSSRLARGRDLLRQRLVRRGVTLGVTALAALLAEQATAAVPAPLLSAACAMGQALAGGVVSASVLTLSKGVLRPMILSKFNLTAVMVLTLGLAGLGTGLLGQRAPAEKPVALAAAEKEDKDKVETGPTRMGVISAIDANKGVVTLRYQADPGRKETTETEFKLAGDVKIQLEHGLLKESREGKRADLILGVPVWATLSVDGKSVVAIQVRGVHVHGGIKAVDAGKGTLTVGVKEAGGNVEMTFSVGKDVAIVVNDGIGKKNDPPKFAKLGDLTEGDSVDVQLSGYDQKTVVRIMASGPTLNGSIKGIDLNNHTLTLVVKGDGNLVDKTLTLAKEVQVDGGKLTDLAADTPVAVRLALLDKNTVVHIYVFKKEVFKKE